MLRHRDRLGHGLIGGADVPRYGQERTHQLTLTTWVGLLKWGIAEQIILSPVTCASVLVVSCLGHCSERRGARSPRRAASGTRQRAVRVSERCASRRRLPRGAVQGTAASCTNPRADVPARHVPDAWPAVRPCVHAEGSARFAPAVRPSVRGASLEPLGGARPSAGALRPARPGHGPDRAALQLVKTRALYGQRRVSRLEPFPVRAGPSLSAPLHLPDPPPPPCPMPPVTAIDRSLQHPLTSLTSLATHARAERASQ